MTMVKGTYGEIVPYLQGAVLGCDTVLSLNDKLPTHIYSTPSKLLRFGHIVELYYPSTMRFSIAFLCAVFSASAVLSDGQHATNMLVLLLLLSLSSPLMAVLAFQHPQTINRHTQITSSASGCSLSRVTPHHFSAAKGDDQSSDKPSKNTAKRRTATTKQNAAKKRAGANVNKKRKSSTGKGALKAASSSAAYRKDTSKDTSKKKSSLPTNRQLSSTVIAENENTTSSTYYIQFSRVFQRHVVYTANIINEQHQTTTATQNTDQVIRSFQFLDDAISTYPKARIVAPRDLPFPPPLCTIDWTESSPSRLSSKTEEECETTIAGMGLFGLCELEYATNNFNYSDGKFPSTSVVNAKYNQQDVQSNEALRTLLQLVSSSSSSVLPRHFFRLDHRRFALGGHTPDSIRINHARVVSLLSCGGSISSSIGLAMSSSDVQFVLSNFPQLCLYDNNELENLVRFLLQPLPPSIIPSVTLTADTGVGGEKVDWPQLTYEGYGVGLTLEQATKAMRLMPELMALYYEDSRKPSVGYMYTQLQMQQMSPQLVEEVQMQLGQFLEGADFVDTLTCGYLYCLGVSWKKLRLLLSAFPLWTTNNLDPGWELMQKGPVRSTLKRPSLDYLRQRLQIRPSDIYKMIKTHTRLSTYDAATKILPTLNKLQQTLDLRDSELKQLILRMPSVIGIGTSENDGGKPSAFDQRIDFFQNEGKVFLVVALNCCCAPLHYLTTVIVIFSPAGMSIKEIKESVLNQPSLIQYGIASLRLKLDFFFTELGIPHEHIGRIIHTSPAIMGLSLTDTLRPKVASIMELCALHPYEVGMMVTVSPPTLFLGQKSKIEPALKYLASALSLDEPRDLGELVLKAPRLLRQGLATSLMRKIDLIANALPSTNDEDSTRVAAELLRQNPALFDTSNAVLSERIERCLSAEKDVAQYLRPSQKGRKKLFQYPTREMGDPILMSNIASFDSLTKIYPDVASAAKEMDMKKVDIVKACKNGFSIDAHYFSTSMYPRVVKSKRLSTSTSMANTVKTVSVSMFCSGGIYPSDSSVEAARGQSTTGGFAIQISSAGTDETRLLFEISNAANKCFGIRVPLGREASSGNKLLIVFPLVNPSRNRCNLFSCASALRVLEAFLATTKRNDIQLFYDIQVHTDSTYAWKFVRDHERLMSLGSCFTSQEMISKLEVTDESSFNIDIFHPLARSFSRLNGQEEPPQSTNHRPFYNSRIYFCSSFDGKLQPGEIKTLKKLAKSAAMWQFNRERSFVPK